MKKALWPILEVLETIAIAIIAVFIIRTFVAQPFLVSGSSMEPTFHSGDYLLVDQFTYNFRKPKRGEVVVFKNPKGDSFFIKRIIGMPGERIVLNDGKVKVFENGSKKVLEEKYARKFLSEGHSEYTLDKNEYFVMGDNRGFSFDSRSWGPLKRKNIIGLVRLRLWPPSDVVAFGAPSYK
ncbi:MAG: signal peptidase I [Candidatus Magasanikbacteria bacterium]